MGINFNGSVLPLGTSFAYKSKDSKMKKAISVFLFMIFFSNCLFSQKVVLELNIGNSLSRTFLKGEGIISDRNHQFSKMQPTYSIGVSGKIYKFLYLKSEIGYNKIQNRLEASFIESYGVKPTVNSEYSASYLNFSLLPEIRFEDKNSWFFLNAGIGSFSSVSSEFFYPAYNNGVYARDFRGTSIAFESNLGAAFKYKGVGLLWNVGYKYVAPQKSVNYLPGLGFKQLNYRFGICYDVK